MLSLFIHEAINFNVDIANNNTFKSYKCKAKLLGNTVPDGANEILRNTTNPMPLKYLSNFWRSVEMPLINCQIKLKLKWTKYSVLSAVGADYNDANSDIISLSKTQNYVTHITLSAKDIQKFSKLLSKGFERSVYWNKYKTKSENKNTTNEYRNFLESNFVGVNRLFVLVYSNVDDSFKRFKTQRYHVPKGIIKNYVMINRKIFYEKELILI